MPQVGRGDQQDGGLLQLLDVAGARMVVETLSTLAWKAVAADSDVAAGPGAFFATENESGCEECRTKSLLLYLLRVTAP